MDSYQSPSETPKAVSLCTCIPLAPSGFATHCLSGIPDEPRSGFSYPIRLEAGSSPVQSRLRQLSPVTARVLFTHGRQLLMSAFLWKPLCSRLLSAPSYTSGNRSSERLSVLSEATPRVRTAAWPPGPRPHSFLFCDRAAGRGGHTAGDGCSLAAWPTASLFSVSVTALQGVRATPRVTAAAWQPGPRPHSFLFL